MLELTRLTAPIVALAYSADGSRLVCVDQRGRLTTFVGMREERSLNIPGSPRSLTLDAAQPLAIVGCREGTVHWLDLEAGRLVQSVAMPLPIAVSGLALISSNLLVVGQGERFNSEMGRLTILEAVKAKPERHRLDVPTGVWSLAGVPGQRRVLYTAGATSLYSWDINQPDPQRVGNQPGGVGLCVSPDGQLAATATPEYAIHICGLASARHRRTLQGHSSRVMALTFSMNGRTLLSGAWGEGELRAWDIDSARVHCLQPAIGRIQAVACSPDGLVNVAGSDRGIVVVWDNDEY
jgi:hypothetical protein